MSEICLIDLKSNLEFDTLNIMANELVKFAVDNSFAVFFQNSGFSNLIIGSELNQFILLSDSFIYQNCGFLTTEDIDFLDIDSFRQGFLKKFEFLNKVLSIIFSYGLDSIDIYISEGGFDALSDFSEKLTTADKFVFDLCDCVINSATLYSYGFPTIKFIVNKSRL